MASIEQYQKQVWQASQFDEFNELDEFESQLRACDIEGVFINTDPL